MIFIWHSLWLKYELFLTEWCLRETEKDKELDNDNNPLEIITTTVEYRDPIPIKTQQRETWIKKLTHLKCRMSKNTRSLTKKVIAWWWIWFFCSIDNG